MKMPRVTLIDLWGAAVAIALPFVIYRLLALEPDDPLAKIHKLQRTVIDAEIEALEMTQEVNALTAKANREVADTKAWLKKKGEL